MQIDYNCKQKFHRSKKIFLCLGHVGVKKKLRLIQFGYFVLVIHYYSLSEFTSTSCRGQSSNKSAALIVW